MKLEDYFEFLAPNSIHLKNTPFGIEIILYDYIHRGQSAEEIVAAHSNLSREQIYATILYYLHNREEVHQYMTRWIERRLEIGQTASNHQGLPGIFAEEGPKYEVSDPQDAKFLLDEHVNPRLRDGLRNRWPAMIVWCLGDPGAPPHGSSDPNILSWCEQTGFLLVTNNRASMPVHLREHLFAGRHMPGIITLNDKMKMGASIENLGKLWKLSDPGRHSDNIAYMPL